MKNKRNVKFNGANFDWTINTNRYGRLRIPVMAVSCIGARPGSVVGININSRTKEITLTRNLNKATAAYVVDEYGNTLINPSLLGVKRKRFNLHANTNGTVRLVALA